MVESKYASGCIVGGVIGDALGYLVEEDTYEQILQHFGHKGIDLGYLCTSGSKFSFTYATQMTLFTIEGLLWAKHQENAERTYNLASRCFYSYQRWLSTQGVDFSESSYRWALDDKRLEVRSPLLMVEELYYNRAFDTTCITALCNAKNQDFGTIQTPINNSKGCGAVVRVAPVAIAFADSPRRAFECGAQIAAITHSHPVGYLSAGALSSLLAFVMTGMTIEKATAQSISILSRFAGGKPVSEVLKKALQLWKEEGEEQEAVRSFGEGNDADQVLGIGLYAALRYSNHYDKAVKLAVNRTGTSLATGMVCGNIVGATIGYTKGLDSIFNKIEASKVIQQMITRLIKEG